MTLLDTVLVVCVEGLCPLLLQLKYFDYYFDFSMTCMQWSGNKPFLIPIHAFIYHPEADDTNAVGKKDDGMQYRPEVKGIVLALCCLVTVSQDEKRQCGGPFLSALQL